MVEIKKMLVEMSGSIKILKEDVVKIKELDESLKSVKEDLKVIKEDKSCVIS